MDKIASYCCKTFWKLQEGEITLQEQQRRMEELLEKQLFLNYEDEWPEMEKEGESKVKK